MPNLLKQFDGAQWLDIGVQALNDLTDADTATVPPAPGDGLSWNGTYWVPQAPAAGTVLPTAGAGLTGGAASYDVGAGTGITVAADTVALDTTFTDARYVQLPLPAPPVIPAAGAGLAGGVTAYDVGAGAGITVAADTVALDQAFTDALYAPVTHTHPAIEEVTVGATAPVDPAADLWMDTASPDPTSALEERVAVLESMVATLMGDGS